MIIIELNISRLDGPSFFSFFNFDSLVNIEYKRHNEDWIKDGKPKGFFWRAPGGPLFSGSIATQKLSFVWLFRTPHWVNNDTEAKIHMKRLRIFVLIFNIGVIVWFVIMTAIKT